jgi:Icc-related predicted phosphoesterase
MRIAHASDLHGHFEILGQVTEPPDLWVLSGDFFPNRTRGNIPIEIQFQTAWFGWKAGSILRRLQGAPVLYVPGNHDYQDLGTLLRREGVDAREITPQGCSFKGLRFAGFGHIPIINGEWNRETTMNQLSLLTRMTLEKGNPDVLVTHAPPDGILNGYYQGIGPLNSALTYYHHRVRLHLFGHAHEDGGKEVSLMGIRFVNSACCVQVVDT